MNPEGTDLLQTRKRETETKLKMNLCQTVITTIVIKTTMVEAKAFSSDEENENDCIDSGDRDESSDVILAFIDDEEEVERPATTRSGRGIQKIRNWFLFFFSAFFSTNSERADTFLFCYCSSLLYTTKSAKKKFIPQLHLSLSESDRCNYSMNCNTLTMPKTYCVTVQYVYLV